MALPQCFATYAQDGRYDCKRLGGSPNFEPSGLILINGQLQVFKCRHLCLLLVNQGVKSNTGFSNSIPFINQWLDNSSGAHHLLFLYRLSASWCQKLALASVLQVSRDAISAQENSACRILGAELGSWVPSSKHTLLLCAASFSFYAL